MSYSVVSFTYSGGPQVFSTNFALGVLDTAHIKVYVDGQVDGLGDPIEFAFTYDSGTGEVTVTDTLTIGWTGTINRIVPIDVLYVDFEANADVTKRNLARATKQVLMAVQEASDGRAADSALIAATVATTEALQTTVEDTIVAFDAQLLAAQQAVTDAQAQVALATDQVALAAAQAVLAAAEADAAAISALAADASADAAIAAVASIDLDALLLLQETAAYVGNIGDLTVTGLYRLDTGATGGPLTIGPADYVLHMQGAGTAQQIFFNWGSTTVRISHRYFISSWSSWSTTVMTDGAQTIAGVKTFSSSPIAPTPTVGDNTTAVATTAFVRGELLDEDDMVSNSATRPPSQQSVKAYVDANASPSLYLPAHTWGTAGTPVLTDIASVEILQLQFSLSSTSTPGGLQVSFSDDAGATWAAWNTIAALSSSVRTFQGTMVIDLASGLIDLEGVALDSTSLPGTRFVLAASALTMPAGAVDAMRFRMQTAGAGIGLRSVLKFR